MFRLLGRFKARVARTATDGQRTAVIVVQNLPVPFDRRVWLEATTLRQAGWRVICICPKAKGFDRSKETLEGIDIYRYRLPFEAKNSIGFIGEFLWCFLRTSMRYFRIRARHRVDVLHICNPPETYAPLALAAKATGAKFLFDHHDLSPEMYDAKFGHDANPNVYKGLLALERWTFRTADAVITTNESHRHIALTRGKMHPNEVTIVRSGPDLQRFQVYPRVTDWHNGKPLLLTYLGEICEQDGVDHLIRALKHLRDDHHRNDFHCVLIGGGPHQPEIKRYAHEIGVDELCTFTGRVSDEDLCRILSSADIAVDPDPLTEWSDQSTMNKIMEYMFFGLPIASYDLKEARFSAQDAAVYATPNDTRALAKTIIELADDPEQRAKMGAFGRDRLERELAWEHSAPHLLRAYEQLVSKGA